MTVEELLKPRYKVIADYPESPYKVGDIEYNEGWSDALSLEDFPAIFRKLEWWEERKPEDMPEYVKRQAGLPSAIGDVKKVKGYIRLGRVIEFETGEDGLTEFWIPATEEEYKNQKK